MRRDTNTARILATLAEAQDLIDKREYESARDLLLEVRRSEPGAARSANLSYWLAIVSDYLEDFEMAMTYIEEALQGDPLGLPFNRSFDIIVERIRKSLTSASRRPDDAAIPRLYELLVRSAEADMASHLAMARFHAHAENFPSAMKLLQAITTLDPTNAAAWTLYADVARRAGATAVAESAAFEAAALASNAHSVDALPLFAIPGRATG